MDTLSIDIDAAQAALPSISSPLAVNCPLGNVMTGSSAALMPVKPREWLVENLLPVGGVTLYAADGGVGKSLIAKQIANAVASGTDFLDLATVQAPVFAIYGEDDGNELVKRQQDILREGNIAPEAVADYHFTSLFGLPTLLGSFDKTSTDFRPNALFEGIREKLKAVGARLIIIDNVTQCYPGDINVPANVTRFLQALNSLALEINGAVLLLAHVAKSEGSTFAGTAAWRNGVRQALTISKVNRPLNGGRPRQTLSVTKANYGSSDVEIHVEWHGGAFRLDLAAAIAERNVHSGTDEDEFLAALDKLTDERTALSANARASNYAPKIMAFRFPNLRSRKMENAMQALLDDGVIRAKADVGWRNDQRHAVTGIARVVAEKPTLVAAPLAPDVLNVIDSIKNRRV